MKKWSIRMIAMLMFCALTLLASTSAIAETKTMNSSSIEQGDVIYFGSYEQDNNLSNGQEPIEWIVIDIESDGTLVLMSKYGLDVKPYNDTKTNVTWATCSLREWLNGAFYNAVFSTVEKSRILTTYVENEDNVFGNTDGGEDTQDKVYLLSLNETWDYYGIDKIYSYLSDYDSRMCAPTKYALAQGADQSLSYYSEGIGTCWWWLRSPGDSSMNAVVVLDNGFVLELGDPVDYVKVTVRPIIRVAVQPSDR